MIPNYPFKHNNNSLSAHGRIGRNSLLNKYAKADRYIKAVGMANSGNVDARIQQINDGWREAILLAAENNEVIAPPLEIVQVLGLLIDQGAYFAARMCLEESRGVFDFDDLDVVYCAGGPDAGEVLHVCSALFVFGRCQELVLVVNVDAGKTEEFRRADHRRHIGPVLRSVEQKFHAANIRGILFFDLFQLGLPRSTTSKDTKQAP